MKKALLTALVLGTSLTVTGCFDKDNNVSQQAESTKRKCINSNC